MKKFFLFLLFCLFLVSDLPAKAHHCGSHYYVTYKDYYQEELKFVNCDRHSLLKETTVYFYSNGSRRTYTTNTIFNSDGTILESGCSNVKHIIYGNKHYFTFYKNKKYQIIDENGNYLSIKNYKSMREVSPNKLLVKLNKKWGIIDLNENIVVPIKYKDFEQINQDLFITKLNGYYGICDSSNNILLKNEYDKIKPLYETYLLKKYNKWGLINNSGKIILLDEYDSIKKLGEYILIEKDNRFGVLDSAGNIIANPVYKKIKLERNSLKGKNINNNWVDL